MRRSLTWCFAVVCKHSHIPVQALGRMYAGAVHCFSHKPGSGYAFQLGPGCLPDPCTSHFEHPLQATALPDLTELGQNEAGYDWSAT